tara:strand:+ start:1226 stop:1474 length:249 start_codon:yes stop_codon:yes gene_type:complete
MWTDETRPSKRIERILRGKIRMEDEDEGIQSACRKYIYDGAVSILAIEGKEARNKALSRVPVLIRPYIEMEARRIYELRKKK